MAKNKKKKNKKNKKSIPKGSDTIIQETPLEKNWTCTAKRGDESDGSGFMTTVSSHLLGVDDLRHLSTWCLGMANQKAVKRTEREEALSLLTPAQRELLGVK